MMKLLALIVGLVLSTQNAAQPADAQQTFAGEWTKRPIVLKQTLYSIAYGFTPSGSAITIVSPDKGAFFEIRLISEGASGFKIGAPITDRDAKRLLDKVASTLGSQAPKLLDFKPGTKMMATARFVNLTSQGDDRTRLLIDLRDDLSDDIATQLKIQWPQPFSQDFTERKQVEAFIAGFVSAAQ